MGGRVEKKRWERKFSVHMWRKRKTFIVNLMEKRGGNGMGGLQGGLPLITYCNN
jgi:hypothetical protein